MMITPFLSSTCLADFEWLRPPIADGDIKGVSVLVHGLNINPQRMRELGNALNSMGQEVFLISLTGHRNDKESFGQVTRDIWLKDLEDAVKEAQQRSVALNRPLNFVGYSLGAVIGVDLISQNRVHFERMIMFAPALSIRMRSKLVLSAKIFGQSFVLPSLAPREYRMNEGTTMAAYEALFASAKQVNQISLDLANVPTLIFVDPQDELINASGLQELIQKKELTQWQIIQVSNEFSTLTKKYHHLIIDQASVGADTWSMMLTKMREHLNH